MARNGTPGEELRDASERDPRPVVRLPRAGLPGGAIAAIASLLALLLFLVLDGRRRHVTPHSQLSVANPFVAPPPLTLPPEPMAEPDAPPPNPVMPLSPPSIQAIEIPRTSVTTPISPQPVIVAGPPVLTERPGPRLSEPALVLDTGSGDAGTPVPSTSAAGQGGPGKASSASEDKPVGTTMIGNRTTTIPVGTVIPAVLETPIDSARPGFVRAIVSEDACGFDGKRVLVPRGSRLIGEYQADVRPGQNRVLVTWTRLMRPDGVIIRIGSPAADALGGAGIPGHVNTFFFQRFASAVLQSALTIGVNLASRPSRGSVIVGLPTDNVGAIGKDLLPGGDLKPKIKVKQGAVLNVFVARDLDFSGAPLWPQGAR